MDQCAGGIFFSFNMMLNGPPQSWAGRFFTFQNYTSSLNYSFPFLELELASADVITTSGLLPRAFIYFTKQKHAHKSNSKQMRVNYLETINLAIFMNLSVAYTECKGNKCHPLNSRRGRLIYSRPIIYNMGSKLESFLRKRHYLFPFVHVVLMGGSPGDVSENPVTREKRKKGWRMSCDVREATEGLENEL